MPAAKQKEFSLPQKVREILRADFPIEAYKPVDKSKNQDGKFMLTSLKQMYMTERLNDAFGIGAWDLEYEEKIETDREVLLKGRIVLHEYGIYTPYQFGGAKLKGDLGDMYKSAVTSLLSKCASFLEIGIEMFKGNIDPKSIPVYRKSNPQAPTIPVASEPKNKLNWRSIDLPHFTHDVLKNREWDGKYHEVKSGKNKGQKYIVINDRDGNKNLAIPLTAEKIAIAEEYKAKSKSS